MSVAAVITACHSASRPPSSGQALQITQVDSPQYGGDVGRDEEIGCRNWHLTPREVEQFFRLSKQYDENPYSFFYQTQCSISGELRDGGKAWTFKINGGATATWTDGHATRYWGCSAKACGPLVQIATDFMNPEEE